MQTVKKILLFTYFATSVVAMGTLAPGFQEAPSPEDEREAIALKRFVALLEKSPRKGTALDRVYGYHVERGTLEMLVKTYQERVEKDRKDGTSWLILGLIESQRGRDAAAVRALEQAEAMRLDDPLPSYYLGQALVLVGQPDEAAKAFERALGRKPSRTDVLEIFQALGRVYQRTQKTKEAMDVWDRLDRLFPGDPRVQEQIAAALSEEGQPEAALGRYEALAKSSKDPFRQVQFEIAVADLKVKLGRSDEALREYEGQLAKLRPDSWLCREVRHKIEEVFLRNDDQAGLAAYYERWIKNNPEDVEVLYLLGKSLANAGRPAEARTWLDKAVKVAPSRRDLRLALINMLEQERNFHEAAAQYEELSKREPNNPDIVRDWGALVLRDTSKPETERKQAAAAVWRRLIDARPRDPLTAAQVADLLRRAELVDDALTLYRKAIELAPDNPQYHEYLGEYLHALKRADEARAAWAAIAAGPNHNAKNLARLAEVYAGFGYVKQAIVPLTEAIALEPKEFAYRLKLAELLHRDEQFDAAAKRLAEAEKLAEAEEEHSAVLEAQVKNDQAGGTLEARIGELQQAYTGASQNVVSAVRLARYLEAAGRVPEATQIIQQTAQDNARSTPAWLMLARMRESAGQLADAADAYRRLADIDRRNRTEYLGSIAKLEARLGRAEQALAAGRDLIAAAPGNPEHYEAFATLCFQLGHDDEGLDALRRAVRVNPNDTKALLTLAETLAGLFRTDEAIETYWRAFEKEQQLDPRVSIVSRLTELYLQRNQLDRLLSRLQREQNEAQGDQQKRELGICLAQAYVTSGDMGMGRSELERLLTTNERDVQLLQQLSKLAEDEGDVESAAKYQKRLVELAPSDEASQRLAQLYVRYGELGEAQSIWRAMAEADKQGHEVLQALDSLQGNDRSQSVVEITESMLRKNPSDWEALYREAAALSTLKKNDEAKHRFQQLLALKVDDDEQSAIAKARSRNRVAQSTGARPSALQSRQTSSIEQRIAATGQIRIAAKLELRANYSNSRMGAPAWSPADFGQARMAALAWLYAIASKDGKQAEDLYLAAIRSAKDKKPPDVEALWNWYLLSLVRTDYREAFEAAAMLAHASDVPESHYVFLAGLSNRTSTNSRVSGVARYNSSDSTPPLAKEEIDQMMASLDALRKRRPDLVTADIVGMVHTELKRAKKDEQADTLYADMVNTAEQIQQVTACLGLAAQRGDVDAALALTDKLERLQALSAGGGLSFGGSYFSSAASFLGWSMAVRADAKAHADILRILDHYLTLVRRRNTNPIAALRGRSRRGLYSSTQQWGLQIWVGKQQQRYTQISFPYPNEYYDTDALTLLRNAYELFKHDDLSSDLVAHIRSQIDAAKTPEDALYPRLALSYLLWWDEDRDEAIAEFAKAIESTGADSDLRLVLAELHEQRGEFADALDLVESIKPLDNVTTQRKENLALRLSVLTGNLDRARQAAERLFGLRLDTQTQMSLSSQMHQLGMHELADSVLARARRRAGGKAATLVGLMLQYQRQDKNDIAEQIALQILRTTTPVRYNMNPNVYVQGAQENENARQSAIQVLARSGKLKSMIERVQEQLARTPNALQLHQALADYYRAAGEREKVREEQKTILDLRPDDANLRFVVANDLLGEGKSAEAVDLFKVALEKDPSLFGRNYYQVIQAFSAAGKNEELADLFEKLDVRQIGPAYYVMNMIETLLGDEKTRDRAIVVFKKAWEQMPNERTQLLVYLRNDAIWQLPEMYDYARQALLPDSSTFNPQNQWNTFQSVLSYGADGRVFTHVSRVFDLAEGQSRLEELAEQVAKARQEFPAWTAGELVEAMIDVRLGEPDKARAVVAKLFERKKKGETLPATCLWMLGNELEKDSDLRDLAIACYETAVRDRDDTTNIRQEFSFSPARRLVELYRSEGRDSDIKRVLKEFSKPVTNNVGYDEEYLKQMRIGSLISVASQLVQLGDTAEAIPIYSEASALAETVNPEMSYRRSRDQYLQQIRTGMTRAFSELDEDQLSQGLGGMIDTAAKAGASEADGGKPSKPDGINLVILIHPRELDRAMVRSLFAESLKTCAKKPELLAPLAVKLAEAKAQRPDDLSVQIAASLVALANGDTAKARVAVDEMLAFLDRKPLEPLPQNGRANARQRAEALRYVPVWLVARGCWQNESLHDLADKLAPYALEAARRQIDNRWLMAMQRERGETALKQGDRAAAEQAWSGMLEQVLLREAAKKKTGEGTAIAPTAAPATGVQTQGTVVRPMSLRGTRATLRLARPRRSAQQPAAQLKAAPAAPSSTATVAPLAPPQAQPGSANVPIVTLERYNQAMQIAKLALENDMHDLAIRAMREAHAGGPPVQVQNNGNNQAVYIATINRGGTEGDPIAATVLSNLSDLDRLFQQHNAPADRVYELYRDAVLPKQRPAEVFLYGTPSTDTSRDPQSVAAFLIDWAVRAGKVADLHALLEQRRGLPTARMAADVIDARLALAQDDEQALAKALQAIDANLKSDKTRASAELACHAALPAYRRSKSKSQALAVLESAIELMENPDNPGSSQQLIFMIARDLIKNEELDRAKARIESYLSSTDRLAARYGGDYGIYQRKYALHQVALEYAQSGLVEQALEALGRYADAPVYSGGDPPAAAALATVLHKLESLPAEKAYETLHSWTMPDGSRKSVRALSGIDPQLATEEEEGEVVEPPPAAEESPSVAASSPGHALVSNLTALIDLAKGAGKLDAMSAEIEPLVAQKIENADLLQQLIRIQQSKASDLQSYLQGRIEWLESAIEKVPDPYRAQNPYSRAIPGGGFTKSVALTNPREPLKYPWNDHLLIQTILEMPDTTLHSLAIREAQLLMEAALRLNMTGLTSPLKEGIARARVLGTGSKQVARERDGNLAYWISARISNGSTRTSLISAPSEPWWVAHDGHVAQVVGASRNALLFSVPLEGAYEYSVDLFAEPTYGGGLIQGGNVFKPFNPNSEVSIIGFGDHDQLSWPWPRRPSNTFARVTAKVTPDKVRYFVGSQLLYEDDDPSSTAPWVGLFPWSHYISVMRNPEIRGNPTVPQEVRLCVGDRLEGWSCLAFNERRPMRRNANQRLEQEDELVSLAGNSRTSQKAQKKRRETIDPDDFDWCAQDGVIMGRRTKGSQQSGYFYDEATGSYSMSSLSLLSYYRPLQDGDVLTYEFFYQAGQSAVHPVMDRLILEINPSGVRMLNIPRKPGETLPDPPAPRQGATLPLKEGDWNLLRIRVRGPKVAVELNNQSIFEHTLPDANSRQFGLLHDRSKTNVRVRNITLRGDWPTELSDAIRDNMLARRPTSPSTEQDRRARHNLIGETYFGFAAADVTTAADRVEGQQRFELLARWVLPNPDHAIIRMQGSFESVGPTQFSAARIPALELVKVATTLGRLDALRQQVQALPPTDDLNAERARVAFLAVIESARRDKAATSAHLERLKSLLADEAKKTSDAQFWPEYAAASGVDPTVADASALLDELVTVGKKKSSGTTWLWWVMAEQARVALPHTPGYSERSVLSQRPGDRLWHIAPSRFDDPTSTGLPTPLWTNIGGKVSHHSATGFDLLYFAIPITGDFELSATVSHGPGRELGILYGGQAVIPKGDGKHLIRYKLGQSATESTLTPPLDTKGDAYKLQMIVKNRRLTLLIDGRQVNQRTLPKEPEPWLMLVSPPESQGSVTALTISGGIVPDVLHPNTLPELLGWDADRYGEGIGSSPGQWERMGDEIVGRRREAFRGSAREALLQYHRPLVEDATVAYEFYYDPARNSEVAAALDRTVFLFKPDRVERVVLTDGTYEQSERNDTEARPAEPKIPLKAKDWNKVALSILGDHLSIELNGTKVYEGELEPNSSAGRRFGLFHYADESEARVRKIEYRGKWKHPLPPELIPTL